MAEFQNNRALHKAALLLDFDVSLISGDLQNAYARTMQTEDIVPDSEEERLQHRRVYRREHVDAVDGDTIEVSSGEEGSIPLRSTALAPGARRTVLSSDSEASTGEGGVKIASQTLLTRPPMTPCALTKSTGPIIDLTLSSSDSEPENKVPERKGRLFDLQMSPARPTSRAAVSHPPLPQDQDGHVIPLYVDDGSDGETSSHLDDGAILIIRDEPRSARKPLRTTNASTAKSTPSAGPYTPLKYRRIVTVHSSDSESEPEPEPAANARVAKRTPAPTPEKVGSSSSSARAPRLTKKAVEAAEQQRREAYAKTLFAELNRTVFDGRLPEDTQLKWSKRLLTTAGKARWHRSREGVHTSSIELAVKILDCDERIRNTLSHEMCHLACWTINDDPKEGHGRIFHNWAKRVMRVRPEIEVTTRHDYEINYKYEWKCEQCSKIYGRFSKSINPEECVCGSCREGKLVPLFKTAQRAPRTPKNKAGSSLAAVKGRDSPLIVSSPVRAEVDATVSVCLQDTPARLTKAAKATIPGAFPLDDDPSSDSDVEVLTQVLGAVRMV